MIMQQQINFHNKVTVLPIRYCEYFECDSYKQKYFIVRTSDLFGQELISMGMAYRLPEMKN